MTTFIAPRAFAFVGGDRGRWRIASMAAVCGFGLEPASHLDIVDSASVAGSEVADSGRWSLRGMVSNERYVVRRERTELVARQEGLGRPGATRAALIPIRKTPAWWALAQDERRAILEEQSRHIAIGMRYLPAVARRLHHCRDLGPDEPFDFLTWFEFAPDQTGAFDALLAELRASPEWAYVEREVDVRLALDA